MASSLLDTDTLSDVLKRDEFVRQRAIQYLTDERQFTFSIITRYEILRGLKAKQADKQITAFDALCFASNILPLTDAIIVKAADIYAYLKRDGLLISDADILIASTALTHNLFLITNNVEHFARIDGLSVESWKKS
jgi:tRNA(fMet)-specific endonuclease VapC